jgi:hypothetical protein
MQITMRTLANTRENTGITETIALSCRQVYRLQTRGKALQIQALKGTLYVTLPNDPVDYIIKPGEHLVARSRGLVLVQGLPDGVFRYSL